MTGHPVLWTLDYSIKKDRKGGLRTHFFEPFVPLKFFVSLLYPEKFHKFVLDPFEIPRPKTKAPGNVAKIMREDKINFVKENKTTKEKVRVVCTDEKQGKY